MTRKFVSVLAAALIVLSAISFVSCEKEDPNGISKKEAKVTDFLGLYGKSSSDVSDALINFIIEKDNYDSDGNLYWVVKTQKDNLRLTLDGDEVFTTVTFKSNICTEVSLLYNNVVRNGASLADLKSAYGEGTKMGDNWYDWNLSDNSRVSYFGTKLNSGKKSLLVYRKPSTSAEAPAKMMEKIRKNVGLE